MKLNENMNGGNTTMNSGFRHAAHVATITVCALALTCLRSTAQAEGLGVTATDDGWLHYENVAADAADLSDKTTALLTGTKSADGTCTIGASGTVPEGRLGYYSSTKAFNPQTCQEMVEGGFLTTTSARQLHLSTSSTDPSITADSNLPTAADSVTAGASTNSISTPQTDATSTTATVTRTSSAYTGSRWVDPLFIVITALTVDLKWQHSGSSVPSASYVVKPYEFKYDGWSNSGTPHPPFTFKPGSVNVTASESFVNTDFEQLLRFIARLVGGPGAEVAVIAACGFDTSPAVFKHTESITGKADGSYSWSYQDTKKGGCSNLVHHDNYNGYGTF
jgi:hypothetical protein